MTMQFTPQFCSRANVFITDLPEFLPLMQLNITENRDLLKGTAEAQTLIWGSDISAFLPPPAYVFMADCIYYDEVKHFLKDLLKILHVFVTISMSLESVEVCCEYYGTVGHCHICFFFSKILQLPVLCNSINSLQYITCI